MQDREKLHKARKQWNVGQMGRGKQEISSKYKLHSLSLTGVFIPKWQFDDHLLTFYIVCCPWMKVVFARPKIHARTQKDLKPENWDPNQSRTKNLETQTQTATISHLNSVQRLINFWV